MQNFKIIVMLTVVSSIYNQKYLQENFREHQTNIHLKAQKLKAHPQTVSPVQYSSSFSCSPSKYLEK